MVRTLLDRSHLATTGQIPDAIAQAAQTLGWTAGLYLIDHEQRLLLPTPVTGAPARRPLNIETTLAGRCFRTVEPVPTGRTAPGVWLPVVDGSDRLGVLEVDAPGGIDLQDPLVQERCRMLSHLGGHMIAAKSPYGDGLDGLRRLRPRTVASELLHQSLPPLSFACEGLVISCLLLPAYDVAADAFDYGVADDTVHLMVLDATGHDLRGTILATLALAAYRNARRNGRGLSEGVSAVDRIVAEHGGAERFATGVLGELDMSTGRLRYLNAGHPAPLLMRHGRVVKELDAGRRIMFGLGQEPAVFAEEWLQPGDRVVLYTDGVVEARDHDGEFFGQERLEELLHKAAAAGLPAPETLRRIAHDVLDRQGGVLQDDATLLVAEWATSRERTFTAVGGVAAHDLSPHGEERQSPRR
ncbi:stage II sporulation protein E [Kineococcus rhizosphaerae]|uniref:Stage II sporulation protein E n=2 Tax=Kineococcus rhizosphaerae TaxID=559628 RepID=A0A2T0QXL8_9ACTN|nr:stage II sporulation protein E [Kineococcus rhizosphaerae]